MALINCPECGKEISDKAPNCPNCGYALNIPLPDVKKGENKKKFNGWFVLMAAVLIMIIGAEVCSDDESVALTPKEKAHSEAISHVKKYLKENLKDPKSYESNEWSEVVIRKDGGYIIRHKYRANNSFGGKTLEDQVFSISSSGTIESVVDYSQVE